jgi:hypothetical protein
MKYSDQAAISGSITKRPSGHFWASIEISGSYFNRTAEVAQIKDDATPIRIPALNLRDREPVETFLPVVRRNADIALSRMGQEHMPTLIACARYCRQAIVHLSTVSRFYEVCSVADNPATAKFWPG